jgi:hypothetical protein
MQPYIEERMREDGDGDDNTSSGDEICGDDGELSDFDDDDVT